MTFGITYDEDVLHLVDLFRGNGFAVAAVVITQYAIQPPADVFRNRLNALGIPAKLHYPIEGIRTMSIIVSDDGYGKNEFVETTRPLVVVTAPVLARASLPPASRSSITSTKTHGRRLCQIRDFPRFGICPLRIRSNIAYEAATADLDDANIIDSFHLEAYNKTTVNYNRDVEGLPGSPSPHGEDLGREPLSEPHGHVVFVIGWLCHHR